MAVTYVSSCLTFHFSVSTKLKTVLADTVVVIYTPKLTLVQLD